MYMLPKLAFIQWIKQFIMQFIIDLSHKTSIALVNIKKDKTKSPKPYGAIQQGFIVHSKPWK